MCVFVCICIYIIYLFCMCKQQQKRTHTHTKWIESGWKNKFSTRQIHYTKRDDEPQCYSYALTDFDKIVFVCGRKEGGDGVRTTSILLAFDARARYAPVFKSFQVSMSQSNYFMSCFVFFYFFVFTFLLPDTISPRVFLLFSFISVLFCLDGIYK